jgi:hypothetical protein
MYFFVGLGVRTNNSMGAGISKAVNITDIVSKQLNETIISSAASCAASTAATQEIKFGEVEGKFTITDSSINSNSTVNIKCIQSFVLDLAAKNKLTQDITKETVAETDSPLLSYSEADTKLLVKSIDAVVNSINIEDIKSCLVSSISNQLITAGHVTGNVNIVRVNMNSTQSVVLSCVQKSKIVTESINHAETTIKAIAQSKATVAYATIIASIVSILLTVIGGFLAYRYMQKSAVTSVIDS